MRNSLYLRLSLSFTLILLIVGLAYIIIVTLASNKHFQETTQRLNADVAKYLLEETSPFKDGEVNEEALGVIMHSMMAVNPGIEVYLVQADGEILSYVVLDKNVKLSRISTEPIEEFIETGGEKYILGDDPRNPGEKTIFSATKVIDDGAFLGYIYIVLVSEKYENITAAMSGNYWLRIGANSFLVTLTAAFAVGLFLIWLLTKNLRVVIHTVNKFKEGDLNARIPESASKGELAVLAGTFNSMSDTIVQNIEELKKVDQLRRELIANVSHDLRNPLAIIHGYIETLLIKKDTLSEEEKQTYLNIVLQSSEKLTHLVGDLFELSKLEVGQVKLAKESFFVNELMSDATLKHALAFKEKGIRVDAEISESMPQVFADLALIDRVIQNLIDNAIKYTPKNGLIMLKAHEIDGGVEITVENSGKGISQEELPHIFDRYYKVDKGTKNIQGTGLGLAIVKKILDIHNCDILVESIPENRTTFSFKLPIN